MSEHQKKVLIIDDSALMRKHLRTILEDAGYVVSTARNGEEGLEAIKTFQPDAVTLDINMPVMDGLTCLSLIMTQSPVPVLMVSSLTEKGALATFEALELGAIDYVAKPGGTVSLNMMDIKTELLKKLPGCFRARLGKARGLRERLRLQRESVTSSASVKPERKSKPAATIKSDFTNPKDGLVVIGVSTGGPGSIESLVTQLPGDFPWPIVIAQHMPSKFTGVFANRLNSIAALNVAEVNRPTLIEPGCVLIAKGDADMRVISRRGQLMVNSKPSSSEFHWHPSVELLVQSVGEYYSPESVICVQLTGMGNDGAQAMTELHAAGARTIAESEESAVVFGMPKELIDRGGADVVLPLEEIPEQLISWVQSS